MGVDKSSSRCVPSKSSSQCLAVSGIGEGARGSGVGGEMTVGWTTGGVGEGGIGEDTRDTRFAAFSSLDFPPPKNFLNLLGGDLVRSALLKLALSGDSRTGPEEGALSC